MCLFPATQTQGWGGFLARFPGKQNLRVQLVYECVIGGASPRQQE